MDPPRSLRAVDLEADTVRQGAFLQEADDIMWPLRLLAYTGTQLVHPFNQPVVPLYCFNGLPVTVIDLNDLFPVVEISLQLLAHR